MVGRSSRRLTACALACALTGAGLLAPDHAHAQALAPTLLEYQVPSGCPSVSDFQASVQRRSARIRFVDEGSHERELSIFVRKNSAFTLGELRLVEADGTLRQRSVRFTSCAEAIDGLALIATVSLDPRALLQPIPVTTAAASNAAPGRPASSAPSTSLPASRPSTKPPASKKTSTERLPPSREPSDLDATPAKPSARASSIEVGLGAQLSAYFHAFPATAIGGSAFLDLTFRPDRLVSPLIRGAVAHVERRSLNAGTGEDVGEASFSLTVGRLFVCPLRLGGHVFELRPCVGASGGSLRASSTDTADARTRRRPFWSLGSALSAAVRVAEPLEIVLDVGGSVALVRDRFVFSGLPFWQTPGWYVESSFGLRGLLP